MGRKRAFEQEWEWFAKTETRVYPDTDHRLFYYKCRVCGNDRVPGNSRSLRKHLSSCADIPDQGSDAKVRTERRIEQNVSAVRSSGGSNGSTFVRIMTDDRGSMPEQRMTAVEWDQLSRALVRVASIQEVPFSAFESDEFHQVIGVLKPGLNHARLPSAKVLGTTVLTSYANQVLEEDKEMCRTLSNLCSGMTLAVQAWRTAGGLYIVGSVITSAEATVCLGVKTWKGRLPAVISLAKEIEDCISRAEAEGITVKAVCTNLSSAMQNARNILAYRRKDIIFLPCGSDQGKLFFIKDILEIGFVQRILKEAIRISLVLKEGSINLISVLERKCDELYGRTLPVHVAVISSWTSVHTMVASLIRIRGAIKAVFAHDYGEALDEDESAAGQIALREQFWVDLGKFEELLRILTEAHINLLKPDLTPASFLAEFGRVFIGIRDRNNFLQTTLRIDLMAQLEKAFASCEVPLLLLSHALHPSFRLAGITRVPERSTSIQLAKYAVAYYRRFFQTEEVGSLYGAVVSYLEAGEKDPDNLLGEWRKGSFKDIQTYCLALKALEQVELANLILRLCTTVSNTSGCDRVFGQLKREVGGSRLGNPDVDKIRCQSIIRERLLRDKTKREGSSGRSATRSLLLAQEATKDPTVDPDSTSSPVGSKKPSASSLPAEEELIEGISDGEPIEDARDVFDHILKVSELVEFAPSHEALSNGNGQKGAEEEEAEVHTSKFFRNEDKLAPLPGDIDVDPSQDYPVDVLLGIRAHKVALSELFAVDIN